MWSGLTAGAEAVYGWYKSGSTTAKYVGDDYCVSTSSSSGNQKYTYDSAWDLKSGKKPTNGVVSTSKRQTPDQKALRDLAKEAAKNAKNGMPISYEEAKILDGWAVEYNVPQHHQAYPGSGKHFPGGNYSDHTHIYNIHVPYSK